MIFASIGSMLPFDRLVRAVDEWAGDNPDEQVFIQIGAGDFEPRNAPFARMLDMSVYRARLAECDLFVAHVGMGSILQALEARKQMLLMPRDFARGEHTTDHQISTARRFKELPGMALAADGEDLKAGMNRMLRQPVEVTGEFTTTASPQLLGAVAAFLGGTDHMTTKKAN